MSTTARDEEDAPLLATYDTAGEEAAASAAPASFSTRARSALRNPKRLNGLERALAILAILLLVLTAVFAGLFAGEAVKYHRLERAWRHDHQHPPAPQPTSTVTATKTAAPGPTGRPGHPGKNAEICLTGSCVTSAAKIISSLDTSVDPCEDFYSFANQGWLDAKEIPAGKGSYGTFNEVDDRNKRIIRDIIDAKPDSSLPEADQRNLAHLRAFWQSCTDEDGLEHAGSQPLFDFVDEVITAWRGGKAFDVDAEAEDETDGDDSLVDLLFQSALDLSGKKRKSPPRWDPKTARSRLTAALSLLHSRGVTALFEGIAEGDVGKQAGTNVLWISQAGLGLPSKDYYGDKETIKAYEEVAAKILAEVYHARKEQAVDAEDLAKGVLKLEKEIAAISLDAADLDLPIPTYNPYTASSLQALFPSISFANYFASFSPRPRFPDPVIVSSPAFFGNLTKVVERAAPDVLEAYFVLQASLEYGDLLGLKQPIRKQVDLLSSLINGIPADSRQPRSEICLDSALENFGFLIGRPFVQRAFPGESKNYAEAIIRSIIQAFKDRLPGRSWLDEETRKKALEKVEAIQVKIGYPTSPNTSDATAIERYYALNLPVEKNDFFGNVLRSRVADEKRKWIKVGRPVDRGEWDMVPSEVNAYYQPSSNEIAFPAGISQPPFFSVDWPEYLNFGSFGSVAAHELSHSLDQSGRQYDGAGRLVNWWTNSTNAAFLERQKCFQKQYANYTITGPDGKQYPVDSRLTGGEDGADSGGVAQAFTAWKGRWESDLKGEKFKNYILPGLAQYSREQMFFIAYAQGWARAMTPGEALRRIRTDPHSPTKYRVNGPLSNNAEFAKAFNCPVGSPLHRSEKERCEIW
ncbi:hypothetical protein JCM8097_008090 [Rhodosporidiobolus ruineniae]